MERLKSDSCDSHWGPSRVLIKTMTRIERQKQINKVRSDEGEITGRRSRGGCCGGSFGRKTRGSLSGRKDPHGTKATAARTMAGSQNESSKAKKPEPNPTRAPGSPVPPN